MIALKISERRRVSPINFATVRADGVYTFSKGGRGVFGVWIESGVDEFGTMVGRRGVTIFFFSF